MMGSTSSKNCAFSVPSSSDCWEAYHLNFGCLAGDQNKGWAQYTCYYTFAANL